MYADNFRPKLGKTSGRDSGKRYAYQLRAAINRAGGKISRKGGFSGKRIGRGSATVAQMLQRDRFAACRQRRVIVKARIVKLAGKGMDGAAAHLRYVQRDGMTRDGERGGGSLQRRARPRRRQKLPRKREERPPPVPLHRRRRGRSGI